MSMRNIHGRTAEDLEASGRVSVRTHSCKIKCSHTIPTSTGALGVLGCDEPGISHEPWGCKPGRA